MKMQTRITIFVLVIASFVLSVGSGFAQSKPAYLSTTDSTEDRIGTFPKRQGWVNDYEKLLTANEAAELTAIIESYMKKTGNEIVVVTTKSFTPYPDITYYAKDLAIVWSVGNANHDNALMVMLSKKQGLVQFIPGDTLRKTLTDTICGTIIDTHMLGLLEKAQYGEALIAGVRECVKVLKQ
jgi:uncharacterized membrane protein YgcG